MFHPILGSKESNIVAWRVDKEAVSCRSENECVVGRLLAQTGANSHFVSVYNPDRAATLWPALN